MFSVDFSAGGSSCYSQPGKAGTKFEQKDAKIAKQGTPYLCGLCDLGVKKIFVTMMGLNREGLNNKFYTISKTTVSNRWNVWQFWIFQPLEFILDLEGCAWDIKEKLCLKL